MSIEEFEPFALAHWQGIKAKLIEGNYHPLPVKRVIIPKPDGYDRLLGIPAVIDRMIQQAISQVISPYFEPTFSPYSDDTGPENEPVKRSVMYKLALNKGTKQPWILTSQNSLMKLIMTC
jgi:hypothetical protein